MRAFLSAFDWENLDAHTAQVWGNKVADIYNQQDHVAMYALFNDQAKVKISHEKLAAQLAKLFQLFGTIQQKTLVSAKKVAEKGDETYYKLIFNTRVKNHITQPATLTVSVVMDGEEVSLYGVRINATQALD